TDIVLPAAFFFAKQGLPSLYSKHFYANSWAEDQEEQTDEERHIYKMLSQIRQKGRHLILLSFLTSFLSLLLLIFLFSKRKHHAKAL
ncbi:MAG: hypothetical protein ACM3JI_04645, partial [Anaerolineae bacterium]